MGLDLLICNGNLDLGAVGALQWLNALCWNNPSGFRFSRREIISWCWQKQEEPSEDLCTRKLTCQIGCTGHMVSDMFRCLLIRRSGNQLKWLRFHQISPKCRLEFTLVVFLRVTTAICCFTVSVNEEILSLSLAVERVCLLTRMSLKHLFIGKFKRSYR